MGAVLPTFRVSELPPFSRCRMEAVGSFEALATKLTSSRLHWPKVNLISLLICIDKLKISSGICTFA